MTDDREQRAENFECGSRNAEVGNRTNDIDFRMPISDCGKIRQMAESRGPRADTHFIMMLCII